MALIQAMPTLIDTISKSTGMSQTDKDKLLADIDAHLAAAASAVAAVKFRSPPPPAPPTQPIP